MLLLLAAAAHAASLDDLGWLVGRWRGEVGATVYEETWHAPLGGAMMGSFRLAKDGEIRFYELMTLTAGALRIKHFGPELFAWERRREVEAFTLAELSGTRAVFVAPKPEKRLVYTLSGETLEVRLEDTHPATFTFARVE